MTDKFIRHFIALVATILCIGIYWAAYAAGVRGWWWAGFGVLLIYIIVYQLLGHGSH